MVSITGIGTFCDRCADRHLAAVTGLPLLPEPPAEMVVVGPDGRQHRLAFRFLRAPTGVEVLLDEVDAPDGEGYRFATLGAHDADVGILVDAVREQALEGIDRLYLREAEHRPGWVVNDGDEVAGRLVWDPDGGPYRVVVDGRELSWTELGEALEPYEGWRFRLVIDDPCDDRRPDADVVRLPTSGGSPHPSGGIS